MNSKKACERKVRYTKAEALLQRKLRSETKGRSGSVYHCTFCKKYHLTSKSKNFIPYNLWDKIKPKEKKDETR